MTYLIEKEGTDVHAYVTKLLKEKVVFNFQSFAATMAVDYERSKYAGTISSESELKDSFIVPCFKAVIDTNIVVSQKDIPSGWLLLHMTRNDEVTAYYPAEVDFLPFDGVTVLP